MLIHINMILNINIDENLTLFSKGNPGAAGRPLLSAFNRNHY